MKLYDKHFYCMELYDKQFSCMSVNPGELQNVSGIPNFSFEHQLTVRSNSRALSSDFEFVTFNGVVSENYCGKLCMFNLPCKSYNFNLAVKRCELLATDLTLKNITIPGLIFWRN